MHRRIGFFLVIFLVFTICLDLRAACDCTSALGANNRKAGDTFWTAGNCLAGRHDSACNSIAGDGDCTLTCNGCDYQATDAGGQETGCYSENTCTNVCIPIPELSSPSEIWRSLKKVWAVYVR